MADVTQGSSPALSDLLRGRTLHRDKTPPTRSNKPVSKGRGRNPGLEGRIPSGFLEGLLLETIEFSDGGGSRPVTGTNDRLLPGLGIRQSIPFRRLRCGNVRQKFINPFAGRASSAFLQMWVRD